MISRLLSIVVFVAIVSTKFFLGTPSIEWWIVLFPGIYFLLKTFVRSQSKIDMDTRKYKLLGKSALFFIYAGIVIIIEKTFKLIPISWIYIPIPLLIGISLGQLFAKLEYPTKKT